jgi:hypothetical protein
MSAESGIASRVTPDEGALEGCLFACVAAQRVFGSVAHHAEDAVRFAAGALAERRERSVATIPALEPAP